MSRIDGSLVSRLLQVLIPAREEKINNLSILLLVENGLRGFKTFSLLCVYSRLAITVHRHSPWVIKTINWLPQL